MTNRCIGACTTLLCMVLLLSGPHSVFAEDDPVGDALDGISGDAMLELVKELASDKMRGRRTGWEGGPLVEEWVGSQFANFGLHPADRSGAYLEPYRFASTQIKAPIACTVAGKKLAYGKDFCHLGYSGSGKVQAPVVFCGYGVHRPDLDWDDYAGVDVKGKIVIAMGGLPAGMDPDFETEHFVGAKSSTAADKGAVGFVVVDGDRPFTGTIQARYYRQDLPALWLSQAAVELMLSSTGKKLADLEMVYAMRLGAKSFDTGSQATIEVHNDLKKNALGNNVLARIDGRDPDLKNEIVLVSAHCDSLGVDANGVVFHGADDNASGTAVLVHLADILSLNKFRPQRTIVFCAFTGAQQGLQGSLALLHNSPFKGKVVAVLNMDRVGQGDPVVRCAGVGSYPFIGKRLQGAIPESMENSVQFEPRASDGSDHWPFYEHGIPAFSISTRGEHANAYTTLDDVGGVKASILEIAAKIVGRWVVTLASSSSPIASANGMAEFLVHTTLRPCTFTAISSQRATYEEAVAELVASSIPFLRIPDDVAPAREAIRRPFVARFQDLDTPAGRDPARLSSLAAAGFRLISLAHAKPVDDAYLQAMASAGLIADLTGMRASDLPAMAKRLKGCPAVWINGHGEPLPAPVSGVLFLQRVDGSHPDHARTIAREDVCAFQGKGPDALQGLVDALVGSGLDLSPGPGRKRARDWLGDALVRLVTK